jgi:hypothetical protein
MFFNNALPKITSKSFVSIIFIAILSLAGYGIAYSMPDPIVANRFIHAFGGGFMAFLTCFLVIKDTKIKLNAFQFFVFSLLIVTALGVANEILEFFLQNYFGLAFSDYINDTWLDLISNTIGSLVGAVCLMPFGLYFFKR